PADFEHKTGEFFEVLATLHESLEPHSGVRYVMGGKRGILIAWRIALVMLTVAGIFATLAAIYVSDFWSLFTTLAMTAIGASSLAALRGRHGPVSYDPKVFTPAVEAATGKLPRTGATLQQPGQS